MKTNASQQRILRTAILITFLVSTLSSKARNKPLPFSAASIILPVLQVTKIAQSADLNSRNGIINPLKDKMLNHTTYQSIRKMELIASMDVMNPGNGNSSNEYELLKNPLTGSSRSVEIITIVNALLNGPF